MHGGDYNIISASWAHEVFPDWCFGLVKSKYRKMKIGCLDDIVKAVHQLGSPNVAQLVGTQDGDIIVPMYNWSKFFEEHTIKTALKGITHMHHFHFKSSHPGKMIVKDSVNDTERTINLLHGDHPHKISQMK